MYDALPPLVAFLQGDMPRHVRGSRIKALPEQLQLLLLNGTSFAHLAGRPLWSVQQHSEWSSLGRFCEMYRLFGARDAGRWDGGGDAAPPRGVLPAVQPRAVRVGRPRLGVGSEGGAALGPGFWRERGGAGEGEGWVGGRSRSFGPGRRGLK